MMYYIYPIRQMNKKQCLVLGYSKKTRFCQLFDGVRQVYKEYVKYETDQIVLYKPKGLKDGFNNNDKITLNKFLTVHNKFNQILLIVEYQRYDQMEKVIDDFIAYFKEYLFMITFVIVRLDDVIDKDDTQYLRQELKKYQQSSVVFVSKVNVNEQISRILDILDKQECVSLSLEKLKLDSSYNIDINLLKQLQKIGKPQELNALSYIQEFQSIKQDEEENLILFDD